MDAVGGAAAPRHRRPRVRRHQAGRARPRCAPSGCAPGSPTWSGSAARTARSPCPRSAARPPGAQITSMLCYVHDFDLYTAWAQLMVDGSFEPPERRWAAGTVYLRGQGAGQVKAIHGLDALPPEVSSLVVDSRLPRPGQPSSGSYEGDGYITVRHPDTAGGHRGAQAAGHHRPRGTGLTAMNVLMISPGYPAEMAFFTRGLGQAGADVIGLGDQSPEALPAHRAGRPGALRPGRLAGRRGPGRRDRARPGQAAADRPGGVPVGALHDPGRPAAGGTRAARADGGSRPCRSGTRSR